MIICDSRRFVFVHVQKTGGSAVTKLLKAELPDEEIRTIDKRHAPLGRILDQEPELSDYWIFGFVRDPWDRMVSWWNMIDVWRSRYARRGESLDGKGNVFWRQAAGYADFEEFILRGTEELPRLRRPQIRYLKARGRRADFIGKTETLAEDVTHAMTRVGLSADALDHHNRGKRDPSKYRHYYSVASRNRIEELFAADIAEFGYRF
ncbi:MAG TPA: sulfotransferase family 2 domain-containing protein [Nocardioides sp.]|nr:sulfotransferase family 2 domain-containing protein [Nocardioides sp.]